MQEEKARRIPPAHLVIRVHDEDACGPSFTLGGGPGEKRASSNRPGARRGRR